MAGLIDLGSVFAPVLQKVLDFIPDPAEKAKAAAAAQTETLNAMQEFSAAQTDVNKVEAASPSLFVAGWRPAIGWAGAAAIWVIYPVSALIYITTGYGQMPSTVDLLQLIGGMLGLSWMRSWEKKQGVAAPGAL